MRSAELYAVSVVATVAMLASGCEASPTETGEATLIVRTDKPVYSLAADQGARPTLINLGPDTVFAPMNEYVYVERRVGGSWQQRTPWFVVDGTDISFPIAPNDSLVALTMAFGYVDNTPGTYRFVFEVAYDRRGRHLVDENLTASEPFVLQP